MYSKRNLESTITQAAKSFPAFFVGGPRRAGKTTLVKHLFKNYKYVLLDEMDVRAYATEDPRGFLEEYAPPVIIDEIQNVPELFSYIKARIDKDNKPAQWILTGSQQWVLMKGISESLAGRIAVLHLYPFGIDETLQMTDQKIKGIEDYIFDLKKATVVKSDKISVGDWILKGGYPESVLSNKETRKLWFKSYVQTYIDKDIRGNIKESNLRDFERFVQLIAARTAQEINTAELSRELGVSLPTIKQWLTLLEASGLIFFLMPYYNNFGKRIIKTPRCYFMDTGLVCYLVGLQEAEHALKGPMAGALFETACVAQLYKKLSGWGDEKHLYFFRSTDGVEVDILLESENNIYPLEIKLSSTIVSSKVKNISRWFKLTGKVKSPSFVISTSKNIVNVAEGIKNIHFSLL
ncbi:MAG: ATP-binding protein [Candidatus Omnitrophica bacterium]|nr:ATP-binding protein [Candidatus Omnitrophota bacterium]